MANVALWPIGPGEAIAKHAETLTKAVENTKSFDWNAPCLRIWHQFDMAQMVGRGPHCGLPVFELDKFNETELHHLRSLDRIFVASKWAKQILAQQKMGTKTFVTPFGVDTEVFNNSYEVVRTDTATTFFNCGKWEVRKGHDVLVEAFNAAFNPEDNVRLIVNSYNPFLGEGNRSWELLYKNSKLGNKITILSKRLETQAELAQLMNNVDCGIFPARAEGWNLEALEMMACGKQVIITECTAHTEFCNAANSLLIYMDKMEDAYDGKWFFGQGRWYEFTDRQMEQLIEYMRRVHERKQAGESLYNEGGVKTAQRFSWANTAKSIIQVLDNERH